MLSKDLRQKKIQNFDMFALFDLKVNADDKEIFAEYNNDKGLYARQFYEQTEKIRDVISEHLCLDSSKNNIDKYVTPKGSLDASAIEADWFPKIDAPVFISHSHKDEDFAIQLAGWLRKKCQIESFVDSMVWDYVGDLLDEIEQEYDQLRRNQHQNAANVYMILQGALAKMIAKSKCLIFINTPKSISTTAIDNDKTESPWIYNELLMANLFSQIRWSQIQTFSESQELKVEYYVDLRNFRTTNLRKFIDTCDDQIGVDALEALNEFYRFGPIIDRLRKKG